MTGSGRAVNGFIKALQPPQARASRTQKPAHASRRRRMQGADVGRVRICAHTHTLHAGGSHDRLPAACTLCADVRLYLPVTTFGHHVLFAVKVR
jgi:hypothetical protein